MLRPFPLGFPPEFPIFLAIALCRFLHALARPVFLFFPDSMPLFRPLLPSTQVLLFFIFASTLRDLASATLVWRIVGPLSARHFLCFRGHPLFVHHRPLPLPLFCSLILPLLRPFYRPQFRRPTSSALAFRMIPRSSSASPPPFILLLRLERLYCGS